MARKHILYRTIFHHQEKGKQELGEQLIIRVGKWCNFRCVFCNVAENENVLSIKSSIKEILAITFYKIKYSNFSSKELNVTISWGEPSIFQKETLFILKFFKNILKSAEWMCILIFNRMHPISIEILLGEFEIIEWRKHLSHRIPMIQLFFKKLSEFRMKPCDHVLRQEYKILSMLGFS